ncbi:MAG: universal stress protein [Chloroflexi bacterium]|nr:universal stress protein [Chloroflexota bacterium]
MYQRILVPLDGSQFSEAVLPHAEKLALALNVELVLLHVEVTPVPEFDAPIAALAPPKEIKKQRVNIKSYMKNACSRLENKGARATYLLREGPVAETILEAAEAMQADFIAMSTHGHTGVLRLLLGSVAEQVVHRSKIPVMLIRPQGKGNEGRDSG